MVSKETFCFIIQASIWIMYDVWILKSNLWLPPFVLGMDYGVQRRRSAEDRLVCKHALHNSAVAHTSPRVPNPQSHWINYVSSLTILILTSRHTYIHTLVLPRLGSVFTPLLSIWTCRMFTLLLTSTNNPGCTASLNPASLLISHQTMSETVHVWS